MTAVDDALNRLEVVKGKFRDNMTKRTVGASEVLATVRQRLAEQDTETQRLREERDEWRESRLALMQTITEQGQRAEAAEAENRRLQHQIESLRNALAAYRSALRSGEGESEHLRAVGDRALLAGSESEPDERRRSVSHKWVKAPKSLFATYVCRVCGRDSMVKHYGECSGGGAK